MELVNSSRRSSTIPSAQKLSLGSAAFGDFFQGISLAFFFFRKFLKKSSVFFRSVISSYTKKNLINPSRGLLYKIPPGNYSIFHAKVSPAALQKFLREFLLGSLTSFHKMFWKFLWKFRAVPKENYIRSFLGNLGQSSYEIPAKVESEFILEYIYIF